MLPHLLLCVLLASPEDTDHARELFREGSTMYEATDYKGAIAKFTEALNLIGTDEPAVRLAILFNIGQAYQRQYEIDRNVTNLRQARLLYLRYLDFARSTGRTGEVKEVQAKIARIDDILGEEDGASDSGSADSGPQESPSNPPAPAVEREGASLPADRPPADPARARKLGVGLLAGGGALVVGGAVVAALGPVVERKAQAQVDDAKRTIMDMGKSVPDAQKQEMDDFIAQERRKAVAMIGAGVAGAAVGVVLVGTGAYFMVRAKKGGAQVALLPALGPGGVGLRLAGSF